MKTKGNGGTVERWNGGTVERWNSGTVERWNGGTVERWNGGTGVGANRQGNGGILLGYRLGPSKPE
ncbi:MAG TPA: hypothetical protein VGM67_13105 [Gemmatimonadaceae bacterium]